MKSLAFALCLLLPLPAYAAGTSAHHDPIASLVLALAIILIAAKLGGDLAVRIGQPAVLGELVAGVFLGNLTLVGLPALAFVRESPLVDSLARLGVLVLLFEIGLESTVKQMLSVGLSAFLVATLGVIAPFVLGAGVGLWLLPEQGWAVHVFLGATLCATSVGITARVLKDLGRSQSQEARIILGAAVIDDVLGLVVLAVVTGAVVNASSGQDFVVSSVLVILAKAAAFLVGSLVVGMLVSRPLFALAARLQTRQVLLAVGLAFCFFFAWLADALGLAPIVGAFAAGLILEEAHDRDFVAQGSQTLAELIRPISGFLAPIFFVLMGMTTDLRSFAQPSILVLALALTAAAILGKQVCGLGVLGKGIDRLSVGVGMIPRGEVGLIFANIGLTLVLAGAPVLSRSTYSAVVVMVIVTTLVTPPVLKFTLGRRRPAR
jgi:Kef-type K+ transport system membrane component KefB